MYGLGKKALVLLVSAVKPFFLAATKCGLNATGIEKQTKKVKREEKVVKFLCGVVQAI